LAIAAGGRNRAGELLQWSIHARDELFLRPRTISVIRLSALSNDGVIREIPARTDKLAWV
jgi:hypothetical protein